MVDEDDSDGSLYGGYSSLSVEWCPYWHPDSDPEWNDDVGNPKYDFGIVELQPMLDDGKCRRHCSTF